jgi:hypothetical protein
MRLHAQNRELHHYKQFIFVDGASSCLFAWAHPSKLTERVCLTEVHKTGKNLNRKRGKGRFGQQPRVTLSPHLGKAWSVLAAMNYRGIVDFEIQELSTSHSSTTLPKAVDRVLFMVMFKACILPHLNRCDDGVRRINSCVIIDNCSLHHSDLHELRRLIEGAGAELIYTAPYWARSNAIEFAFNEMNQGIARNRALANADPEHAIGAALRAISRANATAYVKRSQREVQEQL